jgi:hypothetical protein
MLMPIDDDVDAIDVDATDASPKPIIGSSFLRRRVKRPIIPSMHAIDDGANATDVAAVVETIRSYQRAMN